MSTVRPEGEAQRRALHLALLHERFPGMTVHLPGDCPRCGHPMAEHDTYGCTHCDCWR